MDNNIDSIAEKPARRRRRKHRNVALTISIILAAAVLCVIIVYIILYMNGFRPYVRITSENGGTIKFTGMVDKTGIPTKGTLYFSDGSSAPAP